MALSVLCSLGLMLQLMATLLHIVSIATPGWVQFGVFVPARTRPNNNSTVPVGRAPVPYYGPRKFVQLRLGLWDWCEQFDEVSAECQEPEFLPGVGFLAVVAFFSLLLCLALLLSTGFLHPHNNRRRPLTIASLVISVATTVVLLVLAAVYAIGTGQEVEKLMHEASVTSEIRYLGWAFGTEVVSTLLIGLAALFICIDLRHSRKPLPPELNVVIVET